MYITFCLLILNSGTETLSTSFTKSIEKGVLLCVSKTDAGYGANPLPSMPFFVQKYQ